MAGRPAAEPGAAMPGGTAVLVRLEREAGPPIRRRYGAGRVIAPSEADETSAAYLAMTPLV